MYFIPHDNRRHIGRVWLDKEGSLPGKQIVDSTYSLFTLGIRTVIEWYYLR